MSKVAGSQKTFSYCKRRLGSFVLPTLIFVAATGLTDQLLFLLPIVPLTVLLIFDFERVRIDADGVLSTRWPSLESFPAGKFAKDITVGNVSEFSQIKLTTNLMILHTDSGKSTRLFRLPKSELDRFVSSAIAHNPELRIVEQGGANQQATSG